MIERTVKKVVIAQIVYSAALVLICLFALCWSSDRRIGRCDEWSEGIEGDAIDRGLPAGAVASIEFSMLFAASWAVYRKHSRWVHWLIGLFVAVVIVLQHRTVWAMLAITLASAGFIDSKITSISLEDRRSASPTRMYRDFSASIGLRTSLSENCRNSATNGDTPCNGGLRVGKVSFSPTINLP
jgi:hypothetical protein